jgi:hypothetical protein
MIMRLQPFLHHIHQKLICQIPPHDTYIKPFLGSSAVNENEATGARQHRH